MARCELVVFDFDGTLAETRDAVAVTVNDALRAHGLPRVAPPWIHHHMGLPLETVFERCLPPFERPRTDLSALVRHYRTRFAELGGPRVTAMPGADEALRALRGRLPLAIATSREASSLGPLLEQLGWAGWFASVATCDRVSAGKPDPALLRLVLEETDVAAAAAWMVGDTTFDVAMARAAGVRPLAVCDGCHGEAALRDAGADVLASLRDLPDLVAASRAVPPAEC